MREPFQTQCDCPRKARGKHRQPCVYAERPVPKARHDGKQRRRVSVVSPGRYADWLLERRLALPEDGGWAGVYRSV